MRGASFGTVILVWILSVPAWAQDQRLELYLDADYSIEAMAAQAIELGVRTALEEVGYRMGGQEVAVLRKNHRGNVKRSRRHMEAFLQSDTALALIGGLHSPPYLTHREYLNHNNILTLLPWSAAGPITRARPGDENWIFRLSVDDRQAGDFLVRKAVDKGQCQAVALVLLDTGWGKANHKTLTKALRKRGRTAAHVAFFASSIGRATALTLAENVARSGADCVVLLANAKGGAILTLALAERIPTLRLFSHWGILGGGFAKDVPHATRQQMQLVVLQTCGLRRERAQSPILAQALKRALGREARLAEIAAPAGFVHGYDLTRVLIAAVAQAAKDPAWNGDIRTRRRLVKAALEALEDPVEGVLALYEKPFGPYKKPGSAAHEALGADGLCMARFGADGLLEDAG